MKFIDPEEVKNNNEEESQPAEVYSEIAEPELPDIDDAQIRALALAYAKYLKDHDLAPGDATFVEPEEIGVSMDGFDVEFDVDFDDEDAKQSEELLEEELYGGVDVDIDEPDEDETPEETVEEVVEEIPAEEPTEEEPTEDPVEESVEEEILAEEPVEETAEESTEEIVEEEITEDEETNDELEENDEEPPVEEEPADEVVEEEIPEVEEATDESEEIIEEVPAEETVEEEPVDEVVEEEISEDEEATNETEDIVEESTTEEPAEEEPTEESVEEPVEEAPAEEPAEEAPTEESAEKPEEAPEEDKKEEKEDPKKKAAREAKLRAAQKKIEKRNAAKEKNKEKFLRGGKVPLAAVTNLHDKVQDGVDGALVTVGKQLVRGAHRISSTYTNTRRGIGIAVLVTGLLAAGLLVVFDMFTVYEYSYNGKVLGYVKNQEEVTDVLDVAGRQLTNNSSTEADVKFVANQNVTFNPVDSRGKSTDDSDTVVNKLIYMTDIETEAYAVYDGDKVVAVLKDQNDAETLLNQTMSELSTPDRGMKLISAKFVNDLAIHPVNVLLGSVQSNAAAREQMVNGGEMNIYHIAEEGETVESLAAEFGVEPFEIYNEDNSEILTAFEQGDRVCIRNLVSPVSVEMVEEGKLKEVIEFETIKKETDEYYKGDAILEQEGQDGVQIFNGTITKVGGEVTDRVDATEPEILKEKKDKIILIGTAERPKTAATGTFIVPLDHYVVTSEWGGRWGRLHEGMDLAAPTGTPIHASDGGKIIKANYWSGHGLCVEIDHGNGVITRYSHCSAVFVSIGDLVYQGQHIANVGNTGHSFGSHCHFEVRVNGSSQNPRNYINP